MSERFYHMVILGVVLGVILGLCIMGAGAIFA